MAEQSNIKDKKDTKRSSTTASVVKGMVSGTWLTSDYIQRQRWYILLIFCLALLYISYRYNIEQTIRQSRKLETEVKSLHAEYVSKSAELMRLSKRSEVLIRTKQRELGLIESQTPPKRIKAE